MEQLPNEMLLKLAHHLYYDEWNALAATNSRFMELISANRETLLDPEKHPFGRRIHPDVRLVVSSC